MDGVITIETKVDTDGMDKGLSLIKAKALKGLATVGRLFASFFKTVLQTSAIVGGAIGGIFGTAGIGYGIKKAIEDSDTLRGNLQYLVAMVQVAVKNIADKMLPTILNIMNAIVNAIYKALVYINYITTAWFKLDLFKGASDQFASNMNKAQKSSKKIKDNLQQAGFDEMNVLSQNNTGAGAGEGGAGAGIPSFPSMEDVPIPSWLQWIVDNKDAVIAGIGGITAGLIALKLGIDPLKSLGIGLAITGIVMVIQSLINFLKDPTFKNFLGIVKGIGLAIAGIGIAIGSLPVAVAGAVAFIVALVVENYDKIMGLFDKAIGWLEGPFLDKLHQIFGPLGDLILTPILVAINYAKGAFESFYGGIKRVVNGIVDLFKGHFKQGIANVFGGIKDIMLAPINAFISAINVLIRGINKISFKAPDWVPGIGGKGWGFNIPEIPKLAKGGIINQPGRGVAIGGEKAMEGVIPLTDSQQMSLLGEAIGKYITINLTNVTELDGRTIARKVQEVNNKTNFLLNR